MGVLDEFRLILGFITEQNEGDKENKNGHFTDFHCWTVMFNDPGTERVAKLCFMDHEIRQTTIAINFDKVQGRNV